MKIRLLTVVASLVAFSSAHALNLVYNGGFEIKDGMNKYGDGWSTSRTVGGVGADMPPEFYFGDWSAIQDAPGNATATSEISAWLSTTQSEMVTVSQVIGSGGYMAGSLSFDVYSDGYGSTGSAVLDVFFGGIKLDTIDLGGSGTGWNNSFTYDVSAILSGSGGSKTLAFRTATGSEDPSFGWIDNVELQVVPEPATMAALGLGAAMVLRRRKRS